MQASLRSATPVAFVLLCSLFVAHADKLAGNLFHETFESAIEDRWVSSKAEAYNGAAKLQDGGLVLTEEARRYGISSALATPWTPGNDLVVQYELTFTEGMLECGGAYLKVITPQKYCTLLAFEMTINVDFPMKRPLVHARKRVVFGAIQLITNQFYLHCLIEPYPCFVQ